MTLWERMRATGSPFLIALVDLEREVFQEIVNSLLAGEDELAGGQRSGDES